MGASKLTEGRASIPFLETHYIATVSQIKGGIPQEGRDRWESRGAQKSFLEFDGFLFVVYEEGEGFWGRGYVGGCLGEWGQGQSHTTQERGKKIPGKKLG